MTGIERPVGRLFTEVYLERGPPVRDSDIFRRRLGGYVQSHLWNDRSELTTFLKTEAGLTVKITFNQAAYYWLEEFVVELPIERLLNVITIIWRFLSKKHSQLVKRGNAWVPRSKPAEEWHAFVARVLHEENIGYSIDESCGVHFLIDREFEQNRASVLACLEQKRYAGVRDAFESAHRHLDSEVRDTKASVRSMFESLEILVKLIVDTKNLNRWVVENRLKVMAQEACGEDKTARSVVGAIYDGFADWVDGLHNYRHGQGEEEPVAPSEQYTVFVLSSGASYLRLIAGLDQSPAQAIRAVHGS